MIEILPDAASCTGPIQSAMERLEALGKAPWMRSLADYMGGGKLHVIEVDDGFERTANKLRRVLPRYAGSEQTTAPSVVASEYRLAVSRFETMGFSDLFIMDSQGTAVAATNGGCDFYVLPEHRGRGLASELMLAQAVISDGGRRDGFLYTSGGCAAAIASHRLASDLAFQARKLAVPPNSASYEQMRMNLIPVRGGPSP